MQGKPHPIDVHVGGRVRLRRKLLGMSQTALGNALGITFQQVQKYERGANRMGSSRLHRISQVLEVPVSFFFDDADKVAGVAGKPPPGTYRVDSELLSSRESIDLVRFYFRIKNQLVRKRVVALIKVLAEPEAEPKRRKPRSPKAVKAK